MGHAMHKEPLMADVPTPENEPVDPPEPTDPPLDPAALAEQLKKVNAEAKKWRLEAKAHADALEKLNQQSMSDTDRAKAEGYATGRADSLREVGAARVADTVRVAAAGRNLDVDALIDGMNHAAFVDDDGTPDVKAIQKWVDQVSPAPTPDGRIPIVPTGVRDTGTTKGDPAQDLAKFLNAQLAR